MPVDLYDPAGLWGDMSAEKSKRGLAVEINNGRAAMLGIFGNMVAEAQTGQTLGEQMGAAFGRGLLMAAAGSCSGKLHLEGVLENPQDVRLTWRVLKLICAADATQTRVVAEATARRVIARWLVPAWRERYYAFGSRGYETARASYLRGYAARTC